MVSVITPRVAPQCASFVWNRAARHSRGSGQQKNSPHVETLADLHEYPDEFQVLLFFVIFPKRKVWQLTQVRIGQIQYPRFLRMGL
jgi:hypothetical protein